MRSLVTAVLLTTAVLLPVAPMAAQATYANPDWGLVVQPPKVQLGTDLHPSIITIPETVVEESPGPPPPQLESNVPPANPDLLATRHFDYVVSPVDNLVSPGSMQDNSISLGEYARRLRAAKANPSTPAPTTAPQPGQ